MSTYTFNPPEYELIIKYLNKKITKEDDDLGAESEISEVNICHHEPAEISALAKIPSSQTWYIISPVERLNGRHQRRRRASRTGIWKVTGRKTMVKDINGKIIGFKRYLGFKETKKNYSSSSSFPSSSSTGRQQNKSNWIIHEFHSSIDHPKKEDFVLCKLMKNEGAPPSGAVAEAFPAATSQIISPYAMQNDDISVYDYGGYFLDVLGNTFTPFQNIDLLDQPYYSHDVLETWR